MPDRQFPDNHFGCQAGWNAILLASSSGYAFVSFGQRQQHLSTDVRELDARNRIRSTYSALRVYVYSI
jgi:hypothetical protein